MYATRNIASGGQEALAEAQLAVSSRDSSSKSINSSLLRAAQAYLEALKDVGLFVSIARQVLEEPRTTFATLRVTVLVVLAMNIVV